MVENYLQMLKIEILKNNDDPSYLLSTVDLAHLQTAFVNKFGGMMFPEYFTAWTPNFVYYVDNYDGIVSVNSAPRHPESNTNLHVLNL